MIQRGYRALVLWIVWAAAALVIYMGLYQDTEVWEFVRNDPSRITWAIVGLFALGVATSFVLTLILTTESVRVDHLEKVAKDKGWIGISKVAKNFGVGNFFDSLTAILKNNGDLNFEALVDVEFAFYQRIAHALEVIGNLLITLGLIGTVVGLTMTLTGLTSSLNALGHDQEQLLSGLRGAMGGMGTAFYTTLLGSVFGGVLLRVFAHIDQNGVESLEESLTRICLVHCSADLKPSTERDLRLLNSEILTLTNNIKMLQDTLKESSAVINGFATELLRLRQIEGDEDTAKKILRQQRDYHETLREEFQLKRMNRGWWWSVFKNSFRTK